MEGSPSHCKGSSRYGVPLPPLRRGTVASSPLVPQRSFRQSHARQAAHGFDGMNVAEQAAMMQQCRDEVAAAGRHNGNFLYSEMANLPFQILIAGLPGETSEEPRAGCLVFLVGTEILQLESAQGAHGFYTETGNIVELFRDHVRALMGT